MRKRTFSRATGSVRPWAAKKRAALSPPKPVVLTQAQIAVALQVSYRTISEMRRRGEISCFRVGKKLLRFRIEEAIKHMEARGGAAA